MDLINSAKFKIIYTDWYISYNERRPFGNGIHPAVREFIKYNYKHNLKLDYYKILQYGSEQKIMPFDHSQLERYFKWNFPKNIISTNQILDDDFIYIYPLEIKDTLSRLICENKFTLEDVEYVWYLKDIIPIEIIEHLKTGKVKILINLLHDPLYDHISIAAFEKEMNMLGIDGSNIIVLGGTSFNQYYDIAKDSRVKLYTGHSFLKNYVDMMKEFPIEGDLGYICELASENDLNENNIRPYKFLCNNKTMRKTHRAIMGYFSIKYDLLNEGIFSFIEKISAEEVNRFVSQLISNPDKNHIEKLVSILPYELDTQHLLENEKGNFGAKNNMKSWYIESYINIVTETFFGKNVFLSEKIFKPLSNLQPFIVIGDSGTLAELKKLGFKTFEPFIDESYDSEINPIKRIKKIEIEIEKLKNKSIEEIHNWYYSIKDILIHNQKHLYTFGDYECLEEIFTNIKLDYEKQTTWNLQEKKLL